MYGHRNCLRTKTSFLFLFRLFSAQSMFAVYKQNDTTVEPPQPSGVVCGQSPR